MIFLIRTPHHNPQRIVRQLEQLAAAMQRRCDRGRWIFRTADELPRRPRLAFEPMRDRELPIGGVMGVGCFPRQPLERLLGLAQLGGIMPAIEASGGKRMRAADMGAI